MSVLEKALPRPCPTLDFCRHGGAEQQRLPVGTDLARDGADLGRWEGDKRVRNGCIEARSRRQ